MSLIPAEVSMDKMGIDPVVVIDSNKAKISGPEEISDDALPQFTGEASYFSACFNVICCILGVGVLGMPFGLKQTGWGGIAMLVLAWVMCSYTGILLARPFARDPTLRDYSGLGQKAMGKVGRYLASFSQNITCAGVCIIFLVIAGLFSKDIFSTAKLTGTQWTAIVALVLWPFCFLRTMKETTIIALLGVVTSVVAIVCIIVGSAIAGVQPGVKYGEVTFTTFMAGFSRFVFAFAGHTVFPTMQKSMRKPKQFSSAVVVSLASIMVLYAVVAIVSYTIFGQDIKSDIFSNIQASSKITALVGRIAITLHLLFAFAVLINPVYLAIEKHIGLGPEVDLFNSHRKTDVKKDLVPEEHEETTTVIPEEVTPVTETTVSQDSASENSVAVVNESVMAKDLRSVEVKRRARHELLHRILPERWRRFSMIILYFLERTIVLGLLLLIAVLIPFFADLMSLVSGTSIALSIFILPVLFSFFLEWKELRWPSIVFGIAIIAMAIVAGVTTSVFAIQSIIQNIKDSNYHFLG